MQRQVFMFFQATLLSVSSVLRFSVSVSSDSDASSVILISTVRSGVAVSIKAGRCAAAAAAAAAAAPLYMAAADGALREEDTSSL